MGSPIAEMIYQNTGIDLVYIMAAMIVLIIVLFIMNIIALKKVKKVSKRLDRFTKGKDTESLEDILAAALDKIEDIEILLNSERRELAVIRKKQNITYQKLGLVKYNAFFDLSGDLSCALCLLDQENNGFVLNTVYSREGGYCYVKEIRDGACAIELGKEEAEALEQAKNKG